MELRDCDDYEITRVKDCRVDVQMRRRRHVPTTSLHVVMEVVSMIDKDATEIEIVPTALMKSNAV